MLVFHSSLLQVPLYLLVLSAFPIQESLLNVDIPSSSSNLPGMSYCGRQPPHKCVNYFDGVTDFLLRVNAIFLLVTHGHQGLMFGNIHH